MRALAALILSLSLAWPAAAGPRQIELQAPAPGGISYSEPLIVDLRDSHGLLAQGLIRLSLDGQPLQPVPKRPGLPGQWLATIPKLARGPHTLTLALGSGQESLSFSHRSRSVLDRITALADATISRFAPESLGWDWGEGLLLYALARLDRQLGTDRYRPYIESYYRHHLAAGIPVIDWSDKCAPGLAALELWRASKNPSYLDIGERIVSYLEHTPRTVTGGLNHLGSWWPSAFYPQSLWVDSLMMYDVFAARWGQATGDQEMSHFAAEQALIFARYLQHPNGLWKHAWYTDQQHWAPQQDIFWLRGNGWAMASLPEVLEVLPQTAAFAPQHQALLASFQKTAAALLYWQDRTGLWHDLINKPGELYLESSGTALTAYGMFRGVAQGWLQPYYLPAAEKALFGILDRLEEHSDGPSMPGISDNTMPYERLGYAIIPLRNDKPYGLAALILAGIAYEQLQAGQP
ncbi:MAG: glycoside hydrolase family 105 protein [Candidatus Sericytochromatia bacterium]